MKNISYKINIFLPVEFRFRELESRIAIGINYLKKNPKSKIYIGERETLEIYMKKFMKNKKEKAIIIHKGLTSDLRYFFQLKNLNILFTVLDEEGGVYSDHVFKNWPRAGKNNIYWKYVTYVFFWGSEAQNFYLNTNKYLNKEKTSITGNPRFDIAKIFSNKKSSKIKPIKVLINLNFSRINNIVDYDKEIIHRKKYDKESRFESRVNIFNEFQKQIFKEVINLISFLALNNPDIKFIIRPHLVEKLITYQKYFNEIKNIEIKNNLSVAEHFKGVACIIHTGCTTSIEAYFAKVPSIIFLPNKKYLAAIPKLTKKISINCHNPKQVNTQLHKIILNNSRFFNKEKDKLIIKTIYNLKKNSYEIISDLLVNFTSNFDNLIRVNNFNGYFLFEIMKFLKKIVSINSFLQNKSQKNKLIIEQMVKRDKKKFPEISSLDFNDKIKFLANKQNYKNFKYKKVKKNLFLIEKNI